MLTNSSAILGTIYFWSKIILFVGAGATFLGTIGTIWSGSLLEDISNQRIANNENETAIAKNEAAQAVERAAIIEKQNLELRSGVADIEKDALESKRKYLELLERVSPRTLSKEQKEIFRNFLSNNIKGKLNISCGFGNNEGYAFAQEIEQLLNQSGWETTDILMKIFKSNIYGLLLVVKNESSAPRYAGILQEAFNKIDMPVSGEFNNKYEEQRLDLIIGLKPGN